MKRSQDPAEISPPRKAEREYRVYPALIERCAELEPVSAAVAHPCDQSSLTAAVEAAEAGLIRPVLVGPEAKIRGVAEQFGLDIGPYRAGRCAAQPRRRRRRGRARALRARPRP